MVAVHMRRVMSKRKRAEAKLSDYDSETLDAWLYIQKLRHHATAPCIAYEAFDEAQFVSTDTLLFPGDGMRILKTSTLQ